jgi:hypothetical protein
VNYIIRYFLDSAVKFRKKSRSKSCQSYHGHEEELRHEADGGSDGPPQCVSDHAPVDGTAKIDVDQRHQDGHADDENLVPDPAHADHRHRHSRALFERQAGAAVAALAVRLQENLAVAKELGVHRQVRAKLARRHWHKDERPEQKLIIKNIEVQQNLTQYVE